jgi:hypothetical protein
LFLDKEQHLQSKFVINKQVTSTQSNPSSNSLQISNFCANNSEQKRRRIGEEILPQQATANNIGRRQENIALAYHVYICPLCTGGILSTMQLKND